MLQALHAQTGVSHYGCGDIGLRDYGIAAHTGSLHPPAPATRARSTSDGSRQRVNHLLRVVYLWSYDVRCFSRVNVSLPHGISSYTWGWVVWYPLPMISLHHFLQTLSSQNAFGEVCPMTESKELCYCYRISSYTWGSWGWMYPSS